MAKQLEIDWTRARQLMVLSSAEVGDAQVIEGKTVRTITGIVLKMVLTTIDQHGRGRAAWISYETLARESRISLRQAKRAIRALEQQSIVVVDTRKVNHYSIVWSELSLWCPSHLRPGQESAAPVPLPAPVRNDSPRVNQELAAPVPLPALAPGDLSRERSALRTQRSAQETQRSALRTQRSAQEGTQTVSEPYQNRNEPPPPTPSNSKGGGGGDWNRLVEEWRPRISQIVQLVREAQQEGEACEAFLARLRTAWEIALHPANKGKFSKPAGAVVYWMRERSWPAEGVIDATDSKQLAEVTARRQSSEAVWLETSHKLTQIVKAGRAAGKNDEEIRAVMLRNATPREVARFGW